MLGEELAGRPRSPACARCASLGAIAVIETDRAVDVAAATAAALAHGVWLRPFRNLVYAMPPYVSGEEELRTSARRWSPPPRHV